MENNKATNVESTANQSITNYDNSFIFLRDNKYEGGEYTNDTYDDEVLSAGQLMGRVAATGALVVLKSAAGDGSELPVGILTQDTDVATGDTVNINICVGGEVAEEKVLFDGTDTLDTIIDGRQLRDRIAADTVSIKLVASEELTGLDNQ